MSRGGKRKGAGRKAGGKNRPKLQLEVAAETEGRRLTPTQRHAMLKRQVCLCVADKMTPEAIAAVLNLPVDELKVLFPRELQHGRDIVRAELLARLDAQSDAGNVAAGKAVLAAADGDPQGVSKPGDHAPGSVQARALRLIEGGKS